MLRDNRVGFAKPNVKISAGRSVSGLID